MLPASLFVPTHFYIALIVVALIIAPLFIAFIVAIFGVVTNFTLTLAFAIALGLLFCLLFLFLFFSVNGYSRNIVCLLSQSHPRLALGCALPRDL